MEFFLTILMMMGRVLVDTVTSPLFLCIYFLLFWLVYFQNKRVQRISAEIVGVRKSSCWRSSMIASLFGIVGGLFGSFLLIVMGVDLSGIAITQLWVVALVLMLIQQRFLCFAYAAGVLAVSSLLIGYPDVNIPQLMGLVAILHMVESLLILLNGSLSPLPVYVKQKGRFRGGFNLQIFWPIPLIAILSVTTMDPAGGMFMPDWWPLLPGHIGFNENRILTLLPVLAVLGYGEITTTRTPRQTASKSAFRLFLFSLALLVFSVFAAWWPVFLPVVAIFSPLGHEFVIWLGIREENNRPPRYVHPQEGFMILDVLSGSPAHRAGVQSGDIVTELNGVRCCNNRDFNELIEAQANTRLRILRRNRKRTLYLQKRPNESAGIILAPDESIHRYLAIGEDSLFNMGRMLWRGLKQRGNRIKC